MTKKSQKICTTIAYLIGVNDEYLERSFPDYNEWLADLRQNDKATVVRHLCNIRTTLLRHAPKIDREMMYELKNLNSIKYFDSEIFKYLERQGVAVIKANYTVAKYHKDLTELIAEKIEECKYLFANYTWLNWEYIKELFYNKKFRKNGELEKEHKKYANHSLLYPFQRYIYWEPKDIGFLLSDDLKFLNTIYEQHSDELELEDIKLMNVSTSYKQSLYEFVKSGTKIVMCVDCENIDVFKFYGMLDSLNKEELSKIERIIMYHDKKDKEKWYAIEEFVDVPIEYIETERIKAGKSSLDIYLAAGITKLVYTEDITSVILCSSDCDYWGLISTLPQIDFCVIYELENVGTKIKYKLDESQITHCAIDDFGSDGSETLKKKILLNVRDEALKDLFCLSCNELTDKIYADAGIDGTEQEKERFCKEFIRTMILKADDKGYFYIAGNQ